MHIPWRHRRDCVFRGFTGLTGEAADSRKHVPVRYWHHGPKKRGRTRMKRTCIGLALLGLLVPGASAQLINLASPIDVTISPPGTPPAPGIVIAAPGSTVKISTPPGTVHNAVP